MSAPNLPNPNKPDPTPAIAKANEQSKTAQTSAIEKGNKGKDLKVNKPSFDFTDYK